ncbi:MAG: exopolyphosphatase [Flavobacteriaceae bacterium]|nr:exopolyphosphatase [Flavobacteriaceae bacterium]
MKIEKFAAIDIGSNAIRLLITNIIIKKGFPTKFIKSSIVRVPVRLGQESFTIGEISSKNVSKIVQTIKAFKHIIKVNDVKSSLAFATSALREANNSKEIIKEVKKKTKLEIEVIDGRKEAKIISLNNFFEFLNKNRIFIYVDVGGGSTEFSIIENGKRKNSKSFKIGTIRMINKITSEDVWNQIRIWIKTNIRQHSKIALIGSGGNINKIFKIAGVLDSRPLTLIKLNSIYKSMRKMSYEERIINFDLNPDRSDVIIPAAEIFLKALEWSGSSEIYVPKVGLADGMVRFLYKKDVSQR